MQVLREFIGYYPKRKHGRYMNGSVMSIVKLDVCAAIVVRCLV